MSGNDRPERRRRRAAVPGSQGTTRDVRRPWKVGKAKSRSNPYMVRWIVAGEVATKTLPTRTLADSFRSRLVAAMEDGEAFDVATGLPLSMLPSKRADSEQADTAARTWLQFCVGYVAARWDGAAAKSRDSMTDSLATVAIAMIDTDRGPHEAREIRRAFLWAVHPANSQALASPEISRALSWLRQHGLPIDALDDPPVMLRVAHRLTLTLDGRLVAGDTWRRRRRGLNAAMEFAVASKQLGENPLERIKARRAAAVTEVDPRVVVTHAQARDLLTAVSYVGSWDRGRGRRLVAFFGVLYYAGLRPAEAVALRESDCALPAEGWGTLTLARSLPVTTKKWTDHGERHDPRGLKQRDVNAVRVVPIPPWLVTILREHVATYGPASDGRLFRNERGGIIGSTTYSRVWEEARQLALTPTQAASPLAGRPYDLRHAALTTWLNAGIPPGEVAKRAGNSVEILLRRYAGCLDKQADAVNRRIEQAMADIEPELEA